MGSWLAEELLHGSMVVGIPIALLAGLLSFISPCVLPLLPGYLSYVSGLAGQDVVAQLSVPQGSTAGSDDSRPHRDHSVSRRLVLGAVLFVIGFSVPFVLFGTALGAVGGWLYGAQDIIERVMGIVLIVFGFVFIGFIPGLQATKRFSISPTVGLWGAPLLGFTFGLGWTPCTGPVLTAIGTLSLTTGSAIQGALLSVCYCLGLGIPFVLVAFGVGWMARALGFVRRHIRAFHITGGVCLIVLGVLLLTGLWNAFILEIQGVIAGYVTPI